MGYRLKRYSRIIMCLLHVKPPRHITLRNPLKILKPYKGPGSRKQTRALLRGDTGLLGVSVSLYTTFARLRRPIPALTDV